MLYRLIIPTLNAVFGKNYVSINLIFTHRSFKRNTLPSWIRPINKLIRRIPFHIQDTRKTHDLWAK